MDKIVGQYFFAGLDTPGEFAKHKVSGRLRAGEVLIQVAFKKDSGTRSYGAAFGQRFNRRDVVPMAVVVGEIAESFIRIEEQIFRPFISDAVFFHAARLKSDD